MTASEFLADFHIHSRYSRATSRDLNLDSLHKVALRKGIAVVGTGDFTHPGWMEEIREKLVPAREGLFKLREDLDREVRKGVFPSCAGEVHFLLTSEISSIYKRDGQVRKVHNLLFSPSLEVADAITARLERIGNLASDGRPILGLDSRDLLEIVLEASPLAFLVPAHIWTPWFSVLGSKSGFDSLEACFGDLSKEIFSVETGLSSDPSMNWRLSALDRYTLMSNSDAHSADKLGREANRFACDLSFPDIKEALRKGEGSGFLGTVEFFPEQGKYHFDGHRKCDCRLHPAETLKEKGLCPVCGKKVTVGVMHRVEVLADRPEGERSARALPYDRLISLAEVVGEARGAGSQTKGVKKVCDEIVQRLGPEMLILMRAPLEDIGRAGGSLVAEGVKRMREAEVLLDAGYDGEFGVVKLFRPGEREELEGQTTLIGLPHEGSVDEDATKGRGRKRAGGRSLGKAKRTGKRKEDEKEGGTCGEAASRVRAAGEAERSSQPAPTKIKHSSWTAGLLEGMNKEQKKAVLCSGAPLLLIAGPGTGKTLTLTYRIAYLIREKGVAADRVLAVTFTQRAAGEMEQRLRALLDVKEDDLAVRVRTFHALGAEFLREAGSGQGIASDFVIIGEDERIRLLRKALPERSHKEAENLLQEISLSKRNLVYPEDGEEVFRDKGFFRAFQSYQRILEEYAALDYDDLVAMPARLLRRDPDWRKELAGRFDAVSVDEYQDVNHAQYCFLKLLAESTRDLCVIGDPDQAIYGFRGASPEYFLRFEEDFPQGRSIRLVRNYRSTETILSAATRMLASGPKKGKGTPLVSDAGRGPRVRDVELASEQAEAIFIAQTIEGLMGGTDSLSFYADKVEDAEETSCSGFGDIAVLFRLNALAFGIENALRHQGIPFQEIAQADRWQSREGRTLMAVLRWMKAPEDRLAWEQVQSQIRMSPAKLLSGMKQFRDEQIKSHTAVKDWIINLRDREWLPLEESPWKELWDILIRSSIPFGRQWEPFLRSLALSQPADAIHRRSERVTLASLHAAKGLEYPVVFIAGCEEGLLPCRTGGEVSDPEEERRLLFVGMTRAERLLFLTRARSRFLYGQRKKCEPSPFLKDLPRSRVAQVRVEKSGRRKRRRTEEQPPLFNLPEE